MFGKRPASRRHRAASDRVTNADDNDVLTGYGACSNYRCSKGPEPDPIKIAEPATERESQ